MHEQRGRGKHCDCGQRQTPTAPKLEREPGQRSSDEDREDAARVDESDGPGGSVRASTLCSGEDGCEGKPG